ncbi:MAG: acetylornithine deacetylase [SAR86 cluster bacterium]|uniref:Acetylornithine deacetylase n=1 Tax=SAR86 cluster bacterium TaxID=2030880 RepID=A0A2A4MQ38_9GAMM|nr:MAG: acetylornithine deacetylase [SAR86 cluster bacterium]
MSKHFPNLLTQMDNIIKLPSVSSTNSQIDMSNAQVIHFLASNFESLGFSCEIVTSPSSSQHEKLNLIATLGSGPGGLVLAGHTDTVPFDEQLWSLDPLLATEKDGKIYGLGSTDMKGFFPLIMEAVQQFKDEKFKQPLIVLATADEETSMQGAKTLSELGRPKARYAVIGEPTGLKPVKAHKGMMMESIKLLGQSGHSSNPALGKNAMEAMHLVIADLLVYREQLKQKYTNPLFEIPYPTLNLGCIHGGDNPNRICGHCELEFDIRLTPGMNLDTVRTEISQRVNRITQPLGISASFEPLFSGVPAFFADDNSELLRSAERLTGHSAISVAFGTEGPHLQSMGMDTIILGPGNIDQAHQPDEYMSLDMIKPCVKLLQQLISQYCIH